MTVVLLALTPPAQAGGPKYVAGVSYFNAGTMGTPLTWSGGTVTYYTDQGNLSPIYPGPSADALVADSFSQWTSISTTAVTAVHGGQLAEDVNGSNVYVNPDGTITMPADIMPTATGTPVGVVYDYDGSVTDAFLGQGAGDSSECFSNAVFGWIDNFATDAYFAHALIVINGNCLLSLSQETDVEYRLVRILGLVLGLDWSQVNDNVFTYDPPPTSDDYAGLPVMHAIDPPNCIPITLCYSNPYQPKMDDQAAISRLYPVTAQNLSPGQQIFSTNTVRIFGNVYFTNASGQSVQGMQGVNVVARWIDTSTGQPSRAYAASSVSGFLFSGNAGTTVTGFNDPTGLPLNRYGSNDTTLEGFFDLAGLQLPNGATSGQYQITVEAIDPLWAITVGPYEPWQVEPSGSSQPILVNVTLGEDVQQDVLMTGSAVQKPAPFPSTTYASPAAVPTGGDWTSALSPYGDLDYFWFSGQANRTLSVLVTALDETGNPTMNKAQPVIGMWDLSDPGTYPAPANTPSAFNTAILGMTMLNALLTQAMDYRIGIADIRGDGRPDYGYHARILYGDTAQPARASVAGSTPLTIQGLGFKSNTTVSIGNTNVTPLSISATQIVLVAPSQADGMQNITLFDPPSGAASVMTSALTYGAGPNDTIALVGSGSNPWTPAGGQAPNPILVQVLAPDGITPVAGASVFFSATPAVSFSACSGASTCTVITDESGQASTFVTPLSAGTFTITAQLAPASYSPAKQVQTTLAADSSSMELALVPQTAHIAQGAAASIPLTARVLSNGSPLSGVTVNFTIVKGSGTLSPTVVSNSDGYASTTLQLSSVSSDVQVSVWLTGETNAAPTFYGTAVPASGLQVRPIAGTTQTSLEGQSFQPVAVQVTDLSTPPNPVQGASVIFQSTVERSEGNGSSTSGGDTTITQNPTPIILASSQAFVISDVNGLASFPPTTDGFSGALEILGTATAGLGTVPFSLQSLPLP